MSLPSVSGSSSTINPASKHMQPTTTCGANSAEPKMLQQCVCAEHQQKGCGYAAASAGLVAHAESG
jgi:hypothetical protein